METIESCRIFVKVIQFGGFSKAALHLGVPKSTVSKTISRLEAETGARLLLRTTRSQRLTPAGQAFFDRCVGAIQTIEDARRALHGSDQSLAGVVKVTAPEDVGGLGIAPILGPLVRKHPGLRFELEFTDRVVDLVKEGYDLAVRIGTLEASQLFHRKVGTISLALCASPTYLKEAGAIHVPRDLLRHRCLGLASTEEESGWTLRSTSGESARLKPGFQVRSNHPESLRQIAEAGAGVALLPTLLTHPSVQSGKLVRVLPKWQSSGLPVSLVSPYPMSESPRVRLIADEIGAKLKEFLKR